MDETYDSILMKLRTHVAQMDSLDDWIPAIDCLQNHKNECRIM